MLQFFVQKVESLPLALCSNALPWVVITGNFVTVMLCYFNDYCGGVNWRPRSNRILSYCFYRAQVYRPLCFPIKQNSDLFTTILHPKDYAQRYNSKRQIWKTTPALWSNSCTANLDLFATGHAVGKGVGINSDQYLEDHQIWDNSIEHRGIEPIYSKNTEESFLQLKGPLQINSGLL